MRARLLAEADVHSLGDEILDELEGEALAILDSPESHTAVAVTMARSTVELIERLRRRPSSEAFEPA